MSRKWDEAAMLVDLVGGVLLRRGVVQHGEDACEGQQEKLSLSGFYMMYNTNAKLFAPSYT